MNAYLKYLPLKGVLEDLFGTDAWYALKESNHLGTWRKYAERALRAVELSVADTVQVHDAEWLEELTSCIHSGKNSVKRADSVDDVIAALAATMLRVSFIQLGHMPQRKGRKGPFPLRRGDWRLDGFRSVLYVQSEAQKESRFLSIQRQRLGFDRQFDLMAEYRKSKSNLSYAEWCANQEVGDGAA